jgi:hypothetical protein
LIVRLIDIRTDIVDQALQHFQGSSVVSRMAQRLAIRQADALPTPPSQLAQIVTCTRINNHII